MNILIKNCKIIDGINDYKNFCDIFIVKDKIEKVKEKITDINAYMCIDAQGKVIVPGFVDLHCHLREPGFEYKETVESGTEAAAKGGYTTICCMPNTKPVIDNIDAIRELKKIIARSSKIKVIPIGALTINQQGIEKCDFRSMVDEGIKFFSDDGNPIMNTKIMLECLEESLIHGFTVIDHCEDIYLSKGGVINEGKTSYKLDLKGIPKIAEELQVMRDIMLAEQTGASIHIAHISTEGSLNLIKMAKNKGIKVSCEVTPHHISLTEDDIKENDTNYKVNPPLREMKDVSALKKGLKDGIIDVIATDHAPHNISDKPMDFYKAANGISGIELSFSVCYTHLVKSGVLTLNQLVKKMSYNPSKILGIDGGEIKEGSKADIAIIDLNSEFVVDRNKLISKGKNTPYHGRRLNAEVVMTIAKGKIVYEKEGAINVYR
ncbi:MAG TPA: dihydroorotase [Clostridiales bacterium]|nr:dihydroorotase [Clostridiales bacterium]